MNHTTTIPAGFTPEAHHVASVITAAQAMLDKFGGDMPDWLEGEASALQSALGSYWAKREQVTPYPGEIDKAGVTALDAALAEGVNTLSAYVQQRDQAAALADFTFEPALPIRIVLNLSGGVLQGATVDGGGIDVLIVDYETSYGEDADTVMAVPQAPIGSAEPATAEGSVIALWAYETDPAFVDAVFAAHAAHEAAKLCQHCGETLTSNPCAECNGFNDRAPAGLV